LEKSGKKEEKTAAVGKGSLVREMAESKFGADTGNEPAEEKIVQ